MSLTAPEPEILIERVDFQMVHGSKLKAEISQVHKRRQRFLMDGISDIMEICAQKLSWMMVGWWLLVVMMLRQAVH